ncbi:MAG: hypothetical protein R3A47_07350 [Polyangiales bacterium]
MIAELSLPLAVDALPSAVRRFADPNAPGPAKTMAAKGLVPVKGADLVVVLVQLANDDDDTIAAAATDTLKNIPSGVLLNACESDVHPAILHAIATTFEKNDAVLERLVGNHHSHDRTVEYIAKRCSESVQPKSSPSTNNACSARRLDHRSSCKANIRACRPPIA